jgi:hypothetical protein
MKPFGKYARVLSYAPGVALFGSLAVGPPPGFAQIADSGRSEPLRLTIAPGNSSRIAMKTMPKAVCLLHEDGVRDTGHSFKLLSDDEGIIRFNVKPSDASDEPAALAVDCTANGQSRTFGLELKSSFSPTVDMPAPAAASRTPKETDVIRRPLTEEEIAQLSDDEIVKREYPLRPDPKQAPDAYAAWRQVVTQPARRVDARQVSRPELSATSQANTNNWSGFDLKNAPNEVPVSTYDMVQGNWYVPAVSDAVLGQTTYSVLWVGLDGDNGVCPKHCPGNGSSSDLWQAGTGQQITESVFYLRGRPLYFIITSYYAWSEFVPLQSIEELPNFNVAPGDQMYVAAWVGNPGQAASLSGAYGIAFVEDITQGEFTYVYTCRGTVVNGACTTQNQTAILGYQAEWIMERPYEGGVLPDLADYGAAYMSVPYAQLTSGAWINYAQSNTQQLYMYGFTGNLLSAGYYDGNDIEFAWYALQ